MNDNDTPAPESAPASEVQLGQNPEDLEFGVGASDGKVVVKFNTLIQWFDMDPALAIAFAEKIIDCAMTCRAQQAILTPDRKLLT